MAEIFVINKSSALVGQYVSDLPVLGDAPVARQVGFYLSGVTSGSSASAFLASADCTNAAADPNILLSAIVVAGTGIIASSVTGNNITYTAGDSALDFVAAYLEDILSSGASLATFEASIEADMAAIPEGAGVISAIDIFKGYASLEGLVRAMSGASYGSDYSYTESAIWGNHKIIGGKRRIYAGEQVQGSLGEGFLKKFVTDGDLVVYYADGAIAS